MENRREGKKPPLQKIGLKVLSFLTNLENIILAFLDKGGAPHPETVCPPCKLMPLPYFWSENNSITKEIFITIDSPLEKSPRRKPVLLYTDSNMERRENSTDSPDSQSVSLCTDQQMDQELLQARNQHHCGYN